jgi:methionyl-tRNA formyltransferase
MKTILLCGGQGNQKALASKVAKALSLDGVILHDPSAQPGGAKRLRAREVWQKACSVTIGRELRRAWYGMLRHYDLIYPDFPLTPAVVTADINSRGVLDFVSRMRPELVLVSGTNLLREPLIRAIGEHGRIMNLHTGISPYVKGGPSCINWCLALKEFALIGNTVMWLDTGIDSGNIIGTERTPLSGSETLLEMQIAAMEHGHALYLQCVERYLLRERLPNVPQASFATQRLFRSRDWGGQEMLAAVLNYHRFFYKGSPFLDVPANIRLVDPRCQD